ncbi:hypothetical protein ACFS7Z_08935 [Pontibacter toksunensis]|uniref:Uncharacterized protein n=1 Tax=Pontibacter toksunensis TaxID=1332631 RepID=A0ABW6BSG4_9BACT
MNTENRKDVLKLLDAAHARVESYYPETPVYKETPEWEEKRRLLLSDLSLHLAQDAMKGDKMNGTSLKNHLFAILNICGEFFPDENYKKAAALIDQVEAPH